MLYVLESGCSSTEATSKQHMLSYTQLHTCIYSQDSLSQWNIHFPGNIIPTLFAPYLSLLALFVFLRCSSDLLYQLSRGPGVSTQLVCSQGIRAITHSQEPSLGEGTGAGPRWLSQMDLEGLGDGWQGNPQIIVYITARLFSLLIINLVLAGIILVIRFAVNHWLGQLARGLCPMCWNGVNAVWRLICSLTLSIEYVRELPITWRYRQCGSLSCIYSSLLPDTSAVEEVEILFKY